MNFPYWSSDKQTQYIGEPFDDDCSALNSFKMAMPNLAGFVLLRSLRHDWLVDEGNWCFVRFLGFEQLVTATRSNPDPSTLFAVWCLVDGRIAHLMKATLLTYPQFMPSIMSWRFIGDDPRFPRKECDGKLIECLRYEMNPESELLPELLGRLWRLKDIVFRDPAISGIVTEEIEFGFAYTGSFRPALGALFSLWDQGWGKRACPHCGKSSYIHAATAGLSGGWAKAFCPSCTRTYGVRLEVAAWWKTIRDAIQNSPYHRYLRPGRLVEAAKHLKNSPPESEDEPDLVIEEGTAESLDGIIEKWKASRRNSHKS